MDSLDPESSLLTPATRGQQLASLRHTHRGGTTTLTRRVARTSGPGRLTASTASNAAATWPFKMLGAIPEESAVRRSAMASTRRSALYRPHGHRCCGTLRPAARPYHVAADAKSFGQWPDGRAAGTYAFDRLPSQQGPAARRARSRRPRAALEKAGFKPAADAKSADVLVSLGARISAYDPALERPTVVALARWPDVLALCRPVTARLA